MFACGTCCTSTIWWTSCPRRRPGPGKTPPVTCWEHRREGKTVRLTGQNGVRYTVPQYLDPEAMEETVTVRFRVGKPYRDADLAVYLDGRLLRRVHKRILSPGEMEQLTLRRADLTRDLKQITIQVEEGAQ